VDFGVIDGADVEAMEEATGFGKRGDALSQESLEMGKIPRGIGEGVKVAPAVGLASEQSGANQRVVNSGESKGSGPDDKVSVTGFGEGIAERQEKT
jgi:hypothetical protein